mgnify:FL=1|jgi:hypothetical protein
MYIFCDCSDCGSTRVIGPCYLEEFYQGISNIFLNDVRTKNKIKKTNHDCTMSVKDEKTKKNSILQVSII